jgi:hypothetical protein
MKFSFFLFSLAGLAMALPDGSSERDSLATRQNPKPWSTTEDSIEKRQNPKDWKRQDPKDWKRSDEDQS